MSLIYILFYFILLFIFKSNHLQATDRKPPTASAGNRKTNRICFRTSSKIVIFIVMSMFVFDDDVSKRILDTVGRKTDIGILLREKDRVDDRNQQKYDPGRMPLFRPKTDRDVDRRYGPGYDLSRFQSPFRDDVEHGYGKKDQPPGMPLVETETNPQKDRQSDKGHRLIQALERVARQQNPTHGYQ